MKIRHPLHLAAALLTAGSMAAAPAVAADINFGKPGEPVELVVGYQPYYTEAWSGVVMRDKKFYEKYLPKGSKVDFQIGPAVFRRLGPDHPVVQFLAVAVDDELPVPLRVVRDR